MGPKGNFPRPPGQSYQRAPLPAVNYYDADGLVRPELVDEEALAVAEAIQEVAPTQLRRFYQEVQNLRGRLARETDREEGWKKLRADFKMLKVRAVYARKRPSQPIPEALKEFLERQVDAVKNAKDFEAFYQHFQAVVGFHAAMARRREARG